MKAPKTIGMLLVLVAVVVTSLLDLSVPYVKEAHAVVGRPLTPVSYAGVARRTTRRAYYGTSMVTPSPYW